MHETASLPLVIVAILAAASSGLPGLFLKENRALGQRIAAALIIAAGTAGTVGALTTILAGKSIGYTIALDTFSGSLHIGLDPLSAIFLLAIFIVSSCSALYGTGYWSGKEKQETVPRLSFFMGLLTASLAALVIARDAIVFLGAWEVMALACFFAMTVEHRHEEVREAGILYLISTHGATLVLFAMFALLKAATGTYQFPAAGSLAGSLPLAGAILITGFIGFGLKAGVMPLHIWLPSAHAMAPSHISALMSGVLIKMGIYGLVRLLSFFQTPPIWWGFLLITAGAVSAVLGVIFALGQHDLKRLLAYHSIENIGIIVLALGVAELGLASGKALLFTLGMAGALLHVLNHGIFKSLLFYGAGSVIHATGTKEIDALGGLARRMPWTSLFFLTGAVAICGLPPLNGFVSEFYIYKGLFIGVLDATGASAAFLSLAVPALALVGGLAVACFVKVYGAAFLGAPRTEAAHGSHEGNLAMLFPMGFLAALCLLIGLMPVGAGLLTAPAVAQWGLPGSGETLDAVAPLSMAAPLFLILVAVLAALFALTGKKSVHAQPTWDCGYLAGSPRIQYTASSFAEMLVKIFRGILRPQASQPKVVGHYPGNSAFHTHIPEMVLELILLPFLRKADDRLSPLRRLQHGQLHLYILYILIVVVTLLVWAP